MMWNGCAMFFREAGLPVFKLFPRCGRDTKSVNDTPLFFACTNYLTCCSNYRIELFA